MRVVIAGVTSGVGKTTVATGIIGALRRRGLRVQPFKAGPDYIDPSYHSVAAGVASRNLDTWMLGPAALRELYVRASAGVDVVVVEGVMGLYDGRSGLDEAGSTAQLAKLLDAPVVLVVDAAKMARSAAAMVLGYQRYDPALHLSGVIANNVGSETHYQWVSEAIKAATGLPVLGYLPSRAELALPERHLGLIPTVEDPAHGAFFEQLVAQVEGSIDLTMLLEIARESKPLAPGAAALFPLEAVAPKVRLGIAMDEAFSFYYQDNLDLLAAWGAELVPFSPLHDRELPHGVAGLYIGGGFPEVYAVGLAQNRMLRAAIADVARAGMPIYAECGGLMYLTRGIVDFDGGRHEMVGLLPCWSVMQRRRVMLGYATVRARSSSFLLPEGEVARGHEFHWSELEGTIGGSRAAYDVLEHGGRTEGYLAGNVLASYIHLHFGANPLLAPRFVEACAAYQKTEAGRPSPAATEEHWLPRVV
jgi:cobyrinic acid a,c-diamide synthase